LNLLDPNTWTYARRVASAFLIQRDIHLVFAARSISEEFSSDTKYRDNGEPAQGATHGRDPRSPKEKEDKERGDEGIPHISEFALESSARSRAAFPHLPG